jgi:vancomycin resistance protein YoaR
LKAFAGPLPTTAKTARVRAADLAGAQAQLAQALANPVQVTFRSGLWTLPPADLGKFVRQSVDPTRSGAAAFSLSLDKAALSKYLDQMLAGSIDQDPKNAQVGWNGERLVSVVESQDGVQLQSDKLAALVEQSFFGKHGPVEAPAEITHPTIDSNSLDKLGITTLLGSGSSNYDGSVDGRATNIEVAANLLNGTLVPPHATFSFLNSIGVISKEKGFVTAQVISGESIGKDIGGGVCQVSTTVFRAAYLAGLPITEWWPHRFRIPFYELDGWQPGFDASILQPTEDPSTWADFKFENPSDKWMLVESWADGVHVFVNIYGADLGYKVESDGPTYGSKFQMLPDEEVVDSTLDPGTINQTMSAGIGQEVTWYRRVFDKNGDLLWERQFYTKYYPKGNVWTVSPDMKGDSPANPDRVLPPLPQDSPADGQDSSSTGQDAPDGGGSAG